MNKRPWNTVCIFYNKCFRALEQCELANTFCFKPTSLDPFTQGLLSNRTCFKPVFAGNSDPRQLQKTYFLPILPLLFWALLQITQQQEWPSTNGPYNKAAVEKCAPVLVSHRACLKCLRDRFCALPSEALNGVLIITPLLIRSLSSNHLHWCVFHDSSLLHHSEVKSRKGLFILEPQYSTYCTSESDTETRQETWQLAFNTLALRGPYATFFLYFIYHFYLLFIYYLLSIYYACICLPTIFSVTLFIP